MRLLVVLSGKSKQFDVEVRLQPMSKDETQPLGLHAGGSSNVERAGNFPIGFHFGSTEAKHTPQG